MSFNSIIYKWRGPVVNNLRNEHWIESVYKPSFV